MIEKPTPPPDRIICWTGCGIVKDSTNNPNPRHWNWGCIFAEWLDSFSEEVKLPKITHKERKAQWIRLPHR